MADEEYRRLDRVFKESAAKQDGVRLALLAARRGDRRQAASILGELLADGLCELTWQVHSILFPQSLLIQENTDAYTIFKVPFAGAQYQVTILKRPLGSVRPPRVWAEQSAQGLFGKFGPGSSDLHAAILESLHRSLRSLHPQKWELTSLYGYLTDRYESKQVATITRVNFGIHHDEVIHDRAMGREERHTVRLESDLTPRMCDALFGVTNPLVRYGIFREVEVLPGMSAPVCMRHGHLPDTSTGFVLDLLRSEEYLCPAIGMCAEVMSADVPRMEPVEDSVLSLAHNYTPQGPRLDITIEQLARESL